jgi:uncharacterized protein RhaS with RHS repeats
MHPQIGRFMQPDPLLYVDGMNYYGYVMNNPIRYIDPNGSYVQVLVLGAGLGVTFWLAAGGGAGLLYMQANPPRGVSSYNYPFLDCSNSAFRFHPQCKCFWDEAYRKANPKECGQKEPDPKPNPDPKSKSKPKPDGCGEKIDLIG